jgi:MFS family permease
MSREPHNRRYARYVLGLLTLVYTLNLLDRTLMILLLQPIKNDLQLSDTQLGFLTGIAFGLFYATLGIPIARWADRGDRVLITSLSIGVWGITVMSCLWVTSFTRLVLARVAAAIGESGCMPPTYSLIGDYFPAPAERTRAMAVYWLASPLAALVSFAAGGWVSAHYGWRVAFFVAGIPGLAVAPLVKLTVAEPRTAETVAAPITTRIGLVDVLQTLWRQHSSRHLAAAIILLWTMGLGLAPWYAAFMMRSHSVGAGALGLWMGIIFGVAGVAGILLGGYMTSRGFAQSDRRQMRLVACVTAALLPCFVLFLLAPATWQAFAAMVPMVLVFNFSAAPVFALMQRLVPEGMRATTLAVVMLLANLIGMGLGPLVVGILSDRLAGAFGSDSLRYAMLAVSVLALWAAYHFWQVGTSAATDVAAIGLWGNGSDGIRAAP